MAVRVRPWPTPPRCLPLLLLTKCAGPSEAALVSLLFIKGLLGLEPDWHQSLWCLLFLLCPQNHLMWTLVPPRKLCLFLVCGVLSVVWLLAIWVRRMLSQEESSYCGLRACCSKAGFFRIEPLGVQGRLLSSLVLRLAGLWALSLVVFLFVVFFSLLTIVFVHRPFNVSACSSSSVWLSGWDLVTHRKVMVSTGLQGTSAITPLRSRVECLLSCPLLSTCVHTTSLR